jgi:hypothetical protein
VPDRDVMHVRVDLAQHVDGEEGSLLLTIFGKRSEARTWERSETEVPDHILLWVCHFLNTKKKKKKNNVQMWVKIREMTRITLLSPSPCNDRQGSNPTVTWVLSSISSYLFLCFICVFVVNLTVACIFKFFFLY